MTLSKEAVIQFPVGNLNVTDKFELALRLKQNREILAVDFDGECVIITPCIELSRNHKGVDGGIKAHSFCNQLLAEAVAEMKGIRV